jgi:LysM repeat protein
MSKNYLTLFIVPFIMFGIASAKVVDCRIATPGTTECNPYSARFIKAKEIKYDLDRKKLIVVKTLPIPKKRASIKVVSVADMIEKYVKVEDSIRFKGTEETPLEKTKKQKIYTRIEKIRLRRKALLEKLQELKEKKEKKRLEALRLTEEIKKKELEKKRKKQGLYVVKKGDTLSTIAAKFNMKTNALITLNNLKKKSALRIGKKLTIPYSQNMIDALANAEYKVKEGDTLISIANKFNLAPKELAKFNRIKSNTTIRVGTTLLLPLPYKIAEIKRKKKAEAKRKKIAAGKKRKMIRGFGKRKLRVTATAYSSHRAQTDKTPFLAAWNNRLRPGMKIIAVSRDMLTRYGMRNGTKVRIGGLPGIYRVRDKMNKRYKKRIDIYMGTNRRKALRWGRRSVVIYW